MKKLSLVTIGIGALCYAVAFMTAGCSSLPEVTLGPADEGRVVSLAAGSEMLVKLEAQLSTGYRWEARSAKGFAAVKDHAVESPGTGIVGGVELQVMKVTALAAGEDEVEFSYLQPFRRNEKPAKSFRVKVVIK
jgi:predicted secreted protein